MNKKKIVIISIFIVIVVGICLLLIFNGKGNKKGYATVEEPDNFVVDTENKENVDIIDNIKINNSQKVKGKIYAKPLNKGKDNVVYMENASIKSDIDNDTCVFEGVVYNNTCKDINRLCIGIVFYSSDDKIIGTVEYYVTDIKNNGSQTVKYDSVYDLSNAYRYTLTYDIVE